MQNIFQTVVSFETPAHGPVELSLEQLRHVSGGLGPNDNWATAGTSGPNDNWAVASAAGPNDNW